MAKAHGLNIYGYLKFLLEHRPSKDMTDEQLEELAPWSEKLQSIKNRRGIIVNYSNSQRAGVILYLTALIFGAYEKTSLDDCTAADNVNVNIKM
ncbi:MAG: transposase domain-containing protein, partial [Clostridiales bacterium]|nr:transposase domain-containing protein [Clostridiales bacterium]